VKWTRSWIHDDGGWVGGEYRHLSLVPTCLVGPDHAVRNI
jgi:hypothetical protein